MTKHYTTRPSICSGAIYCENCEVYHQFSFSYMITYLEGKFSYKDVGNLFIFMDKINSKISAEIFDN